MENRFSLKEKQILITGASSGIGRAIAIAASQLDARLYLIARREDKLKETLSMLKGDYHSIFSSDLTQEENIKRAVDELPMLDGVVHSIGISDDTLCKNITFEDINRVMCTNFSASASLQGELMRQKRIKRGASIIFIASRAAEAPIIGNALYSASKGAIISYANVLSLELAQRNVRVNTISPAMVWSDLIFKHGITKEEIMKRELKYPLKRYGQPLDIANLALYLLSDASCWMTGSNIDITGGEKGL